MYPDATSWMPKKVFDRIKNRISLNHFGYPTFFIDGKKVRVHRFMNPEWPITDHINRDKTDNRLVNLRKCSSSENNRNVGARSLNKTGFVGVSYDCKNHRYKVQIVINGKNKNLGRYKLLSEAVKVRIDAEIFHYGDYAQNNMR